MSTPTAVNAAFAALRQLALENQQLRAAAPPSADTDHEPDDEPEDDTRSFGTHLREAWLALTGQL